MYNPKTHYEHYAALMDVVSASNPERIESCYYMAALYILSAESEVFHLAVSCVSSNGINFAKLYTYMLSIEQITLVKAAHSLYNDQAEHISLDTMTILPYDFLDVVVTALYIRKGGRFPRCDEYGNMAIDSAKEEQNRAFVKMVFEQCYRKHAEHKR